MLFLVLHVKKVLKKVQQTFYKRLQKTIWNNWLKNTLGLCLTHNTLMLKRTIEWFKDAGCGNEVHQAFNKHTKIRWNKKRRPHFFLSPVSDCERSFCCSRWETLVGPCFLLQSCISQDAAMMLSQRSGVAASYLRSVSPAFKGRMHSIDLQS